MYVAVLAYIYGGMLLTSLLEDRHRPLPWWRGQYRALFPGDFGLALALVAGVALAEQASVSTATSWRVFSVVGGLALGLVLLKYQITPEEIARGVMFAPTRIWHQVFVWGFLSAGALAYIVPGLWKAAAHYNRSYDALLALMALGLAIWLGCAVWDGVRGDFVDPERYPIHAPWRPEIRAWWSSLPLPQTKL